MTTVARLDRLSALLAGLAPRVQVSRPADGITHLAVAAEPKPFLHLYLLAEGEMRLQLPMTSSTRLQAPCIVV